MMGGVTLREATVRAGVPVGGDPIAGLLLAAAGWAGGGVTSAVVFQGWRLGADPALDPFATVVAGCLLVGPLVAAALLWQWHQVRMVSTVAALTAAGVVAAVPVLAGARALVSSGQALTAILLFTALWGVALPVTVRGVIVHLDHPWLADDADVPTARPHGRNLTPGALQAAASAPPVGGPSSDASSRAGPPVDDRLPPVRIPGR